MIQSSYTLKKICSNNKSVSEQKHNRPLFTSTLFVCRRMLFNINEDGLANVLIWTTPIKYLIDGIWSKIDVRTKFFIQNCVKLEKLLKYQDYGIDLTQNDLNIVYNKMINHKNWIMNYIEIFEFQEKREDHMYDGVEIVSKDIYDTYLLLVQESQIYLGQDICLLKEII